MNDLRHRNINVSLSPAERRVLLMVVEQCMSNKQIALTLDRSIKTIETHRKRVCEKLKAHNFSELCKIYWTQLAVA